MSSIHDRNPKVILFVGRPSDSRKGLTLLFEAVDVLEAIPDLPAFELWIAGGSTREVEVVSTLTARIATLRKLRDCGRIRLWGRIENTALSELYSRASVLVIPSHSEEFGIVAVEAMMCGCPVVAARTGGLQDIVGADTGTLCEPDDVLALTSSLSAYLRNSQQREVQSSAARQRAVSLFSSAQMVERIAELYKPAAVPVDDVGQHERALLGPSKGLAQDRLSRLKKIFADDSASFSSLGSFRHGVVAVETQTARFVAKFFNQSFSHEVSLFPALQREKFDQSAVSSFRRELYNERNPAAPPMRYAEEAPEPLIICEWLDPAELPAGPEGDSAIRLATGQCQQYRPLRPGNGVAGYLEALERFSRTPDDGTIGAFDIAAAALNCCLTGGRPVLSRSHPQVELVRCRLLLNTGVWPVPLEFRVRCNHMIDLLLTQEEIAVEQPLLAHGDLKPDHVLTDTSGSIRFADFEYARYAVGPLDLALWFRTSTIRGRLDCSAQHLCNRVFTAARCTRESYLCICWIVAELIFSAVRNLSLGNRHELTVAHRLFAHLALSLLNTGIIPSGGRNDAH